MLVNSDHRVPFAGNLSARLTGSISAVAKYPMLSIQLNKGERHRIKHSGIKNNKGSLWVRPLSTQFRVAPSGEVVSYLCAYIKKNYGTPVSQYNGKDYWHLDDIKGIENIIREFGELKI